MLEVEEDQTILEAALDSGLELSHDCKMGVCMTCPAKLVRRLMRMATLTMQPQHGRHRTAFDLWQLAGHDPCESGPPHATERLHSSGRTVAGHGCWHQVPPSQQPLIDSAVVCTHAQEAGQVDQSAGMLDDDVKEKGYALLCVSTPQSDCRIRTIEEARLTQDSEPTDACMHPCKHPSTVQLGCLPGLWWCQSSEAELEC